MTYPTFPNPAITWASFPEPCYDPQEKYGDCPGDLLSIINDERIPAKDRIWAFAVCNEVSDSAKRIFAVRCVRETPLSDGRKVIDLLTDQHPLKALDLAYKHAIVEAPDEALAAARDAEWAAEWDAARDAARDASWDAAREAAREAARAAARAAARDAHIEIIKSLLSA